jgi:hypothetical protein
MDKHPQNWFYWLNDYAPAVGLIVTGAFAVIGAGWALFTWQKSKAGSDQKTIGHLNNLLDSYRRRSGPARHRACAKRGVDCPAEGHA